MANIRASAIAVPVLAAAITASTVSASQSVASITATPYAPGIAVSVYLVPLTVLEAQAVTPSDFRQLSIGQVSIDVALATEDVALTTSKVLADSVTATDTSFRAFYGSVDFDPSDPDVDPDPITVADADAKGVGKTLTDAIDTPTDVAVRSVGKAASDSVSPTEEINTKDIGKSLTDTPDVTDAINQFNVAKVTADTATVAEATAKDFTRPNVADSATAADESFRSPGLGKTDSVTSTDAVNSFYFGKAPTETVDATEAINSFEVDKVLADSVLMTDVQVKNFTENVDFDRTDADADPDPVTIAETQAFGVETVRTDTASVTDAAAKNTDRPVSDSVSGNDSPTFDTAKALADTATATEATAKSATKVLTDSAAPSDAITSFAVGKYVTDSFSMSDGITSFSIAKVLADSATIAESLVTQLILGETLAFYPDYVSMDDGNNFVFHRYTTRVPDYTEVLGGSDSLLNSSYLQNASDDETHENYTGLVGGPGLLLTAPLVNGEFITYGYSTGAGFVVNFHYTDAADRTVGGYYFNQTPIL